jgi:hypothetical protein
MSLTNEVQLYRRNNRTTWSSWEFHTLSGSHYSFINNHSLWKIDVTDPSFSQLVLVDVGEAYFPEMIAVGGPNYRPLFIGVKDGVSRALQTTDVVAYTSMDWAQQPTHDGAFQTTWHFLRDGNWSTQYIIK